MWFIESLLTSSNLLASKSWYVEVKGCSPGKLLLQSRSVSWRRLSRLRETLKRVLERMSQTACGRVASLTSHNPPWLNIATPCALPTWCCTPPAGWRWQFSPQGSMYGAPWSIYSPLVPFFLERGQIIFYPFTQTHWLQIGAKYLFIWIEVGGK